MGQSTSSITFSCHVYFRYTSTGVSVLNSRSSYKKEKNNQKPTKVRETGKTFHHFITSCSGIEFRSLDEREILFI